MLPDVRQKIIDGGLGTTTTSSGEGTHLKIGVSSTLSKNQIIIITSQDDIKTKLGSGPLADAVMDSMQGGSKQIYCVSTTGDIAGTKTDIEKTGTGAATYVLNGEPNNNYEVILQIVKGGNLNESTYIYSVNGGETYTQEKTVPVDGNVNIEGTGLSIKFTAAALPQDSFKPGDIFSFTSEAPKMSNAEVLAAVSLVKKSTYVYEFIHVVGGSDESLWAALASEADNMFNNMFIPIYFILETRDINNDEEIEDYVSSLIDARKTVNSYRIEVIATKALVSSIDKSKREVNAAGIISGTFSKASVAQSVGEIDSFPLNGILKLLPEGIENYTTVLDEAGFTTIRQYIGYEGFFITNARMFAPAGSDYQYAETIRTMNKACREVRKQALRFEQSQADTEGIDNLKEHLQVPIDLMSSPNVKELQSGEVVIPDGQDILSTSTLKIKISMVPIPIMRNIDIEMGMKNPFIQN